MGRRAALKGSVPLAGSPGAPRVFGGRNSLSPYLTRRGNHLGRRRSRSFSFGVAPGAWPGSRPTGIEGISTELASGIGFPPSLGTTEDYHSFFNIVKLLENILDYVADKFVRAHPGTPESEFCNWMYHCLEREFMLNFRTERKRSCRMFLNWGRFVHPAKPKAF